MKTYIPFSAYILNNHYDQFDLIDLLFKITTLMTSSSIELYSITLGDISVRPAKSMRLRYKFENLVPNDGQEIEEYSKLLPFCDLIVRVIYVKSNFSLEECYENFFDDGNILKELRNLVRQSFLPGSIYSFSFFASKLNDLHSKLQEKNLFILDESDYPELLDGNHKVNRLKKPDIEICCNCRCISFEPMYFLAECGCFIHKGCFEKQVVENIEDLEFNKIKNRAPEYCSDPNNHMSIEDFKVLVEIEQGKFTLSTHITLMIKFYYLNAEQDATEFCNCNKEHKRVLPDKRIPYLLCNKKCSFCGLQHLTACPKFQKTLNWTL